MDLTARSAESHKMQLLLFAAICALACCSEDRKLSVSGKSQDSRSISPPKGRSDEVKSSFASKFGSRDRLKKDKSSPVISLNTLPEETKSRIKKDDQKKDGHKEADKKETDKKEMATSDVSISIVKPIRSEELKKFKPNASLRERERTPSPPPVEMSERKKKGMSWQPPSRRKQMGKSAPVNRHPIERELDLAVPKVAKVPHLTNLKERVEEANGTRVIPGYRVTSNPVTPEPNVKSTASDSKFKTNPSSPDSLHKPTKSANSVDDEKRRLAASGPKKSSQSAVQPVTSGKLKEGIKSAPSKREKELAPELTGLSLTLNFAAKTGGSSSSEDDDSGASEGEEKKTLLRRNKRRKAKEPEAEMQYNDMVTMDGMKSQKTIKITGLSGPGGTKQVVGGGFNEALVSTVPSAIYVPPMHRRPRKGPSMNAGSTRNQLNQAGDMLGMIGDPGSIPNNDGPSAQQNGPRRRQKPRRQQAANQQEEFVQQPGMIYMTVGNQVIAIPQMYSPEEEEQGLNPDEDELESHFLVQALTRTGKGRVIAVNLIRLWRILACIVINVGIFFLLEFLAINNININGNNGTAS